MIGDGSGQDMGGAMATPRKKWPHSAEWARMDAIAAARRAMRLVDDCMDGSNDLSVIRHLSKIKDELHEIENKLLAVGSQAQE
jgi:hypothetical protein